MMFARFRFDPIRRLTLGLVLTIVIVGFDSTARPEEESVEAYDARIRSELEALAPEAVEVFDEANEARTKEEWTTAAPKYAEVAERAPTFVHAVRRLAHAQLMLGDRATALDTARRAVEMEDLPENRLILAETLIRPASGSDAAPASDDLREATRLLDGVLLERPDESYAHYLSCQLAFDTDDVERLGRCGEALRRLEPDAALGYYAGALYQISKGKIEPARELLAGAEIRGMPPEMLAGLTTMIDDMEFGKRGGYLGVAWQAAKVAVPIWLGGFVLLVALGFVLSRATLSAASKAPTSATGDVRGSDLLLRRVYGVILWLTCAYFYVSLPLVLLAVLGAAGGILYGFMAVGSIPIKLGLIVIVIAAVTLWAALKGLLAVFARGSDEDPGTRVPLDDHPRLKAALTEVADKVGTRAVDTVYLEPTTNIAVMERGSKVGLGHGSERCLILGVGALDGMRLGPFKAILAHEYGHFQNKDTAGGGFALAVRRSLYSMAASMAQHGAAAWYNPAWLFLNGFHWVFLRTSQGASRLQEILADRWAALAYGSNAFAEGLRHVIRRSIEFDAHVNASMRDVIDRRVPMQNLYTHEPAERVGPDAIDEAFASAFDRPPSPFDSHPAPKDRIRWVEALRAEGASSDDNRAMAWTLFSNREQVELSMTLEVRQNVLENHGIDIAGPGAGEGESVGRPGDEPGAPTPA